MPARCREPLKIAIGLALLALLVLRVDLDELASAFRVVRPVYLVPALLAFLLLLAVQAWRLHLLIAERTGGFGATFRLVLVGFFFNNLLPSNVGGDAYKAAAVRGGEGSWGGPVGLVVLDRAVGLATTGLVGLVAFIWTGASPEGLARRLGWRPPDPGPLLWTLAALGALVLVGLAALLLTRPGHHPRAFLGNLKRAIAAVPLRTHAALVSLSLLAFGLRWARFVVYLWFFDVTFPPAEVTVVLALVTLVAVVPVGLGGLGVQEGTIAYGMAAFGAPLELGLAVAVLNRAAIWAVSLLGGLLFFVGPGARRR